MYLAIPSPDVVISLFASAGQALGLLVLLVGRTLMLRRQSPSARCGAAARDRGALSGNRSTARLLPVLVGGCVLLGLGLAFQHFAAVDARAARLSVNLHRTSVEGGRRVGDTSLKTLAYSDQLDHPRAIDADDLAARLAAGEPVDVIDVREPEEVEMGHIAGARHCRYPDLDPKTLGRDGRDVVLICYSGNRSSELAERFAKVGVETRFVIGGYEKWVAEGRPLVGTNGERRELRAIPDYPTRHVLLDTPEVIDLVEREGAVFVDVRYPEDLARHALPDVINLPIRRMPSDAMAAAFAALPDDRPIVVPCYDKRSSFYAEILGLRLHRLGKDFRGRYTVPHEFWLPSDSPAHVAAFEAAASRTLLDRIADPVAALLLAVRDSVAGSLLLAILLFVVVLRLALLPFSVRADRDRIVGERLRPRLAELRSRFADDPARALRAVVHLQREAGIRPVRNLVVSVVQLLAFVVLFAAVARAGEANLEAFLWVPALGAPDATLVLPVLVGALTAGIVLAGGRVGVRRAVVAVAVGAGLTWLVYGLSAALCVYLVLNMGWMLAQTALVRRHVGGTRRRTRRSARGPIVPLAEADRLPCAGGKAARLAALIDAGLPVPRGFAVDQTGGPVDGAALLAAFDRLGAKRVAVRSSGASEDGSERSHAGVYETLLDVARADLVDAVETVCSSLDSARARAHRGADGVDRAGSVVVQEMVPARFAGVAFTEDPACAGAVVVEMVEGLGDRLVSGEATPTAWRFGRHSGAPLQPAAPPLDLAPLLALLRRIEARFGRPQDVEWAYTADRGFAILQSRDITVTARDGESQRAAIERERHRLLGLCAKVPAGEIAFAQDEVAELLPRPTTASLALMTDLWEAGGAVDRACRSLGVPYDVRENGDPLFVTVFGRTFRNLAESRRRTRGSLGGVAAFRLMRSAAELESAFASEREEFRAATRIRDALDLTRLSTPDLVTMWSDARRRFVQHTYVVAERINIAADFYLRAARQKLEARGFDAATVLGDIPETVVHRAWSRLVDDAVEDSAAVAAYLETFGHRARFDFELAEPRYREIRHVVLQQRRRLRGLTKTAHNRVPPRTSLSKRGVLGICVDRARRFQVLKEEAKHECLRELAHLRDLLLELGRRLGVGSDVFDLTEQEVLTAASAEDPRGRDAEALRERARQRRSLREGFGAIEVETELTPANLETLASVLVAADRSLADDGELRGERVAGEGVVTGRARVLASPEEAGTFVAGEVLVVRATNPDWMPLFPIAAGIVSEVGGWLSHAAIQAREHHLPAVVGVRGACRRIGTGDVVTLHPDGRVEVAALDGTESAWAAPEARAAGSAR